MKNLLCKTFSYFNDFTSLFIYHPTISLGKSTLLSALSGRLMPIDGSRTEGDGLELGVFTQDLAQDLVR